MKNFLFGFVFLVAGIPLFAQNNNEIITPRKVVVDTFFNKYIVKDPYRWLENVNSLQTRDWVKKENKLSDNYLRKSAFRAHMSGSIDHAKSIDYKTPVKMGKYFFVYAYFDDSKVPGLFYKRSFTGEPMLLVDPGELAKGRDRIMLKGHVVSKDSKLLAFQYSRNGSDWAEMGVVNLETGKLLNDHLKGLKFSGISWLGHGFFYSTYSQLGKFGITYGEKVYFHEVGHDQKDDYLIFQRKNPFSQFSYITTSNERFFVLREESAQSGKVNYFYIDFKSKKPHLMPLLMHVPGNIHIIDSHNGRFFFTSFYHSDNGSIVELDPAHPYQMKVIVPEYSKALLIETKLFADRILAVYQSDQQPILTLLDYSGKTLYSSTFPVATSLNGFFGDYNSRNILFYFTSYTVPPIVYRFNLYTFKQELTDRTSVTFNPADIIIKKVDYPSDTVMVSMVLVYKKGLKLNGRNPTILKAYGGFGVISSPSFDPAIVAFIEKGGVFAFANIRGGGDKGAQWAKAGRRLNKQNSFHDFIAGAEYLIKQKYTSPRKLAIMGGSNGGLVVAAAAIQRPDLFHVVVPDAAPLDMLRFEHFTVGLFNTYEYGSVRDSADFLNLLHYSPYQNIADSVNYPHMLVITSFNDDRVPPFHSYKFVAALQNRPAQKNPILLMVRHREGHTPLTTREEKQVYGFITYMLADKKKSKKSKKQ
jgi:prolyl oligopeptidase